MALNPSLSLCWLLYSSVRSFGTHANLLTSSEWDIILPDLLLPRHWTDYFKDILVYWKSLLGKTTQLELIKSIYQD